MRKDEKGNMKQKVNAKKGMALASTLLMLTIILMLSMLMMTFTLYSSHLTALMTTQVEIRNKLDLIGEDFLRYGEAFVSTYIEENGYRYYNSAGYVTENVTSRIGLPRENFLIEVRSSGQQRTLIVTDRDSGNRVMRVVYDDIGVGGAVNIKLQSWNYGR